MSVHNNGHSIHNAMCHKYFHPGVFVESFTMLHALSYTVLYERTFSFNIFLMLLLYILVVRILPRILNQ